MTYFVFLEDKRSFSPSKLTNTCGLNISANARERHVLGMRREKLRADEGQLFVFGLFSDTVPGISYVRSLHKRNITFINSRVLATSFK